MSVSPSITYSTNAEYRQIFREITLQPSNPELGQSGDDGEIDAETLDENNYDEKYVAVFLEDMYKYTRNHPLFHKLYDAAAATMISTDRSIGMVVLLSYDYLRVFYPAYCDFVSDPILFNELNPWYIETCKALGI